MIISPFIFGNYGESVYLRIHFQDNIMEAKHILCKIIEAIQELDASFTFQFLIDFLYGKETSLIQDKDYHLLETFGICKGDDEDGDIVDRVVREAITQEYLSRDSDGLISLTVKGKKFFKKPSSFILTEDDEQEIADEIIEISDESGCDEDQSYEPVVLKSKSGSTKLKIEIIQALDRKIPLDDFAESHNIELDEVLDELEGMALSGRSVNIDYFLDMILEEEQIDEISDYVKCHIGDSRQSIYDYFDADYEPEIVRLIIIKSLTQLLSKRV